MLKKTTFAFALLLLLNSCAAQDKKFSKNNWYAFTKTNNQKSISSEVYDFSDDMIRMYGENIGYLITEKSYKNFELSLEFRWNIEEKYKRGSATKNSGVMYNIPTDSPDHIWPKGIQFQMKENTTGDFIFLDNITAVVNGKLVEAGASVVSPKFSANENPYGEWNQVLIRSFNGKITQYLNGKLVNQCTEASSTEGKISLNYEGSPIDFRKFKLKNISKDEN
ncbi:3-keto-disaccharide hydrolase [Flavobacterium sp. WC2509]|uniref:3-keto-disaccharide hydrolase n=1 Tax=Flavobacterium sp. WC2509 TaxID=3461406 RepID=UPI0040442456